jgi:ABC-type polysaccharide/polyol phosphate export permease
VTEQVRSTRRSATAGFDLAKRLRLLRRWTRRDFDAKYRRSALSALWAGIQPFAVVAVYAFIFGVIFKQQGGEIPYLSYLLAGMVLFRVISGGLGMNTCLMDNYDLMGHSVFPRELIPLSKAAGVSLELAVTIPSVIIIGALQGITPSITLLALPLVVLSVLLLAAALTIVASTVQVFVRDLQFFIGFAITALFFASPISYEEDQLPDWLRWLNTVNPISVDIDALRDVALRGQWPDWPLFGLHLVLAALLLVGAIAHLRAVSHRIVDLG